MQTEISTVTKHLAGHICFSAVWNDRGCRILKQLWNGAYYGDFTSNSPSNDHQQQKTFKPGTFGVWMVGLKIFAKPSWDITVKHTYW